MSASPSAVQQSVDLVLGDDASWCSLQATLPGCREPVVAWCSQGRLEHHGELVFPNGSVEIVWNLDAPICQRVGGGALEALPDLSISGVCLDAFELRHPVFHRTLGLRMPPEVAHRLLAGVPGAVVRAIGDLRDLWSRAELDELTEALGLDEPTPSPPRVVASRALRWLRGRCAHGPAMSRRMRVALEALRSGAPVAEIAAAVDLSHSQLTRTFKQTVGVTPRRFAGVARLTEACRRIADGAALVEVALDCGFADQAHMTRSFSALAGVTPGAFAAAHYPTAATMKL